MKQEGMGISALIVVLKKKGNINVCVCAVFIIKHRQQTKGNELVSENKSKTLRQSTKRNVRGAGSLLA